MGQRLVISVKRNFEDKKDLCKIYYHWSGYSSSSLERAKDIIDFMITNNCDKLSDSEVILKLIRHLEEDGGGITNSDLEYVKKLYPNETFKEEWVNRNLGIIAVSEEIQADIQSWSEGDVVISINDKKWSNQCFNWCGQTIEEVKENAYWLDGYNFDDIAPIDYNLDNMNWSEITKLMEDIYNVNTIFQTKEGYWCLIE